MDGDDLVLRLATSDVSTTVVPSSSEPPFTEALADLVTFGLCGDGHQHGDDDTRSSSFGLPVVLGHSIRSTWWVQVLLNIATVVGATCQWSVIGIY